MIAVSSVALYRKANALDEGLRQAHRYLAREDLPEFARADINELLDAMRAEQIAEKDGGGLTAPAEARRNRATVRVGVLRGLHLNEGWIVLGEEGQEQKCYADQDLILENAVEGLLNRRVRVSGRWGKRKFIIHDDVEDAGNTEDGDQTQAPGDSDNADAPPVQNGRSSNGISE